MVSEGHWWPKLQALGQERTMEKAKPQMEVSRAGPCLQERGGGQSQDSLGTATPAPRAWSAGGDRLQRRKSYDL